MKPPLPKTKSFCKYSKQWIIVENPKKCASEDYDCENCEYHEVRNLNSYIIKKLRRLEKENEV